MNPILAGLRDIWDGLRHPAPVPDQIASTKTYCHTGEGLNLRWKTLMAFETQAGSREYQVFIVQFGKERYTGGCRGGTVVYDAILSQTPVSDQRYTRDLAQQDINIRDRAREAMMRPQAAWVNPVAAAAEDGPQ